MSPLAQDVADGEAATYD